MKENNTNSVQNVCSRAAKTPFYQRVVCILYVLFLNIVEAWQRMTPSVHSKKKQIFSICLHALALPLILSKGSGHNFRCNVTTNALLLH